MSVALILTVLSAIGGLSGIAALIKILLDNKKVRADATDIEQNVSDKILKNLNADNDAVRRERDQFKDDLVALNARMSRYEWDQYETRMFIIRLISWAKTAHADLVKYGSELESPPLDELIAKLKTPV